MITIAAVRTENSLLCQQNTELKQEVADHEEAAEAFEEQLKFFRGLNMDEIMKMQKTFQAREKKILTLETKLSKKSDDYRELNTSYKSMYADH